VNAAPVFKSGKSDMIKRHGRIRRCVKLDDESTQMTITVEQIKEARKLLGWSQFRLAVRSAVDVTRINHFERRRCVLTHSQLDRIRGALESSGIEFIAETGADACAKLTTPTGQ
jgi:ribosome-binding protein aMBF1 (putative translation factor)